MVARVHAYVLLRFRTRCLDMNTYIQERVQQVALAILHTLLVDREVEHGLQRRDLVEVVLQADRQPVEVGRGCQPSAPWWGLGWRQAKGSRGASRHDQKAVVHKAAA